MNLRVALILVGFAAGAAHGASLSGALSHAEVQSTVRLVGFASTTRLMRSAESYVAWPGIKIGLESPITHTSDLYSHGDRSGAIPATYFVPRLYLAKGLGRDFEMIANFLPSGSPSGAGTLGGLLKYSLVRERTHWFSVAAYGGYTHVDAFRGDYEGDNLEAGMIVSKDYVRFKPFVGAGALLAHGGVRPMLSSSRKRTSTEMTAHFFAGAEIELPINVTFQIDLMDLHPQGSMFVGMKF